MENDKNIADGNGIFEEHDAVNEKKKKSPAKKNKTAPPQKESSKNENVAETDDAIDAPKLDSLLFDSDDGVITNDKESLSQGFEEFMADYKAKIERSLAMARSAFQKNGENEEECDDEDNSLPADIKDSDDTENTESQEQGIEEHTDGEAPQFTMDIGAAIIESEEEDTPEISAYNPEKPRIIDTVFDFAELFIFTLAAVLIITTFFFKHTIVDGDSMMQTLYNGEHLIVSDLFYTPERGDIIVFADYSEGQRSPYVKRVIGIPGDRISVDSSGNVTVNGEPLDESDYLYIDGDFPTGYDGKNYIVKEGEVFVLGDHRNKSYDSASFPYTAVKIDSIIGKVLFRIYPFDSFGFVD